MDWFQLYVSMVPFGLFVVVGLILWPVWGKFPLKFFLWSSSLLFLPAMFVVGHFYSISKEMKQRAGTYSVVMDNHENKLCGEANFDSLTLTLYKKGSFRFNYKPCFTENIEGSWECKSDPGGYYTRFDKVSDSLSLSTERDIVSDTIVLERTQPVWDSAQCLTYQPVYLSFVKRKEPR